MFSRESNSVQKQQSFKIVNSKFKRIKQKSMRLFIKSLFIYIEVFLY